ncbi:MAG: hypothetical protein AAF743_02890 [Planctomycetota bacterium]
MTSSFESGGMSGDKAGWQSWFMGLALSAAFALAGGVVWFLISFYGNFEIGIVAWGIGFLAGTGFLLGAGKAEIGNGIVAAGIALGVILLAKLAVISFVISGNVQEDMVEFMNVSVAEEREYVTNEKAYVAMIEAGNDLDDEAAFLEAFVAADTAVASMSDEEVDDVYWNLALANLRAAMAMQEDGIDSATASDEQSIPYYTRAYAETTETGAEAKEVYRSTAEGEMSKFDPVEALKATFHPLDLLFAALALITAFGIAGRSS